MLKPDSETHGISHHSGVSVGAMLALAAAGTFVVLATQGAALDGRFILIWFTCLSVFSVSHFLAGRIEAGVWAGYLNMIVMAAWLILGPIPALGIILSGTGVAALAQFARGGAPDAPLQQATERIVIAGTGLLAGATIYRLLGGSLPVPTVDAARLVVLLLAASVGMVTSHAVGYWLVSQFSAPRTRPFWAREQRFRLIAELVFVPAIIILPLVEYGSGTPVVVVIMLLGGVNAAYLGRLIQSERQSTRRYVESEDLVRNLSLINQSVQTVLFNLNTDEAMKAACQSAMTITQAQKSAIFVLDADRRKLELAEQLGPVEGTRVRRRYGQGKRCHMPGFRDRGREVVRPERGRGQPDAGRRQADRAQRRGETDHRRRRADRIQRVGVGAGP